MSWVRHPRPEAAGSEYGRTLLARSLEQKRGQLSMFAAMFTFPALSEHMARVFEQAHFGETALSRVHKEMLAVLVSSSNTCQY